MSPTLHAEPFRDVGSVLLRDKNSTNQSENSNSGGQLSSPGTSALPSYPRDGHDARVSSHNPSTTAHGRPIAMVPIPIETDDDLHALSSSFLMIIASEIGDKTFLIAAIMAMRHPRMIVFAGAFGALVVMSALSAAMGHILPNLISRRWTTLAAAGLFLVFGVKMLLEAREMQSGQDKIQEELKEVEEELDAAEGHIPLRNMEEGEQRSDEPGPLTPAPKDTSFAEGTKNLFGMCLGPVFTFILTFLGEWGDRSQIATIALGAAHNVYIITVGTVAGHAVCTGLAVLGGRWLSTKISIKHVTLTGSILFLLFAVIYFYESWTFVPDVPSLDLDLPMKTVE